MLTYVLLALLAAVPPATQATRLAQQKSWDDLYLQFSAARPNDYGAEDRKEVARALLEAARGLGSDPALAVSLAERSAAFDETADAWLLAGELSLKLGQNDSAAKALERAVVLNPADDRAKMLRADLALKEGDLLLAESLYKSIPEQSPQHAAAKAGLEKARKASASKASASKNEDLARMKQLEKDLEARRVAAEKALHAQPVTLGEACRGHTRAICEALKRCNDPTVAEIPDCSMFTSACLESAKKAPFSRDEFEGCLKAIERASCGKLNISAMTSPARVAPECSIYDRLLPGGAASRPAPGAPASPDGEGQEDPPEEQ
jgi:tetratricopeptide (TPR) repeat protein